ncbi:MAG: toxin-antitoxin system YwqK family antitoxin [Planctomycetota bacterium]
MVIRTIYRLRGSALLLIVLLAGLPILAQDQAAEAGEDADVEEAAEDKPAPLGDINNPVKCDMPRGERYYLARLVDPDGRDIRYSRMGSFGGPNGGILDGYEVKIGDEELEIFMDMYHSGYFEDKPVPGFYLRCRVSWELLIRDDGLRYAPGGDEPYDGEYTRVDEETGKTIAKVAVREGLLQGEAKKYHENGEVDQQIPFKDGQEHGLARFFDEDGKPTVTLEFVQGQRHGEGTWFRPDGTIEAVYTYANGRPHGPHYNTHGDGSVKEKGQFKNGKAEGEFIHYDKAGNETKRELYRDGQVVEEADDEEAE